MRQARATSGSTVHQPGWRQKPLCKRGSEARGSSTPSGLSPDGWGLKATASQHGRHTHQGNQAFIEMDGQGCPRCGLAVFLHGRGAKSATGCAFSLRWPASHLRNDGTSAANYLTKLVRRDSTCLVPLAGRPRVRQRPAEMLQMRHLRKGRANSTNPAPTKRSAGQAPRPG
jgi:hypothetical protein